MTTKEVKDKFTITSRVVTDVEQKRKPYKPSYSKIKDLLSDTTTAVEDNMRMMELLPDLVLAKKILVSSILSPKDLSTYKLSLTLDEADDFQWATSDLMQAIEKHFRTTYKLEERLPDILGESLFDVGAYALMILPESTIGDMVAIYNQVREGMAVGLESYSEKSPIFIKGKTDFKNLEFTDDLSVLLAPDVQKAAYERKIAQWAGATGLESADDTTIASLAMSHGESGEIKNNPLVKKVPTESILPVHAPGDPKDHIGYYVLLDSTGNPLNSVSYRNSLSELKKRIENASTGGELGGLIKTTGFSFTKKEAKARPNDFTKKYIEQIDEELRSQITSKGLPSEVEVTSPDAVYHVMLSRALRGLKTKILYVPKDIMHYFAFNYNEYGIGISLLEKTKVFGSLRAILLFAQIMAGVKNSVGRTKLDITLDEDDPDPAETIDTVLHHFAGLQTEALPLGYLSAGDIVRSLQKASVDVNVDGGDAFPGTKTEVSDGTRQYQEPDTDLSDTLKKMHYSGIGVPPEIVESAMDGETATLVVSRNQLYAKQVIEYAKTFENMVTNFIRVYIRCSGELVSEIQDAITEGKTEGGVENGLNEFIGAIKFTLPKPDLARIKSISEAIDEYSDIVDKVVEYYITEDMFADLMNGDLNTASLEALRLTYANLLKRDWMAQQNLMPEVAAKLENGEVVDKLKGYNKTVLKTLKDIILPMFKDEKRLQDRLDKALEEPEEEVVTEEPTGGEELPEEPDEGAVVDDGGAGEGDGLEL